MVYVPHSLPCHPVAWQSQCSTEPLNKQEAPFLHGLLSHDTNKNQNLHSFVKICLAFPLLLTHMLGFRRSHPEDHVDRGYNIKVNIKWFLSLRKSPDMHKRRCCMLHDCSMACYYCRCFLNNRSAVHGNSQLRRFNAYTTMLSLITSVFTDTSIWVSILNTKPSVATW